MPAPVADRVEEIPALSWPSIDRVLHGIRGLIACSGVWLFIMARKIIPGSSSRKLCLSVPTMRSSKCLHLPTKIPSSARRTSISKAALDSGGCAIDKVWPYPRSSRSSLERSVLCCAFPSPDRARQSQRLSHRRSCAHRIGIDVSSTLALQVDVSWNRSPASCSYTLPSRSCDRMKVVSVLAPLERLWTTNSAQVLRRSPAERRWSSPLLIRLEKRCS